MKNLIIKSVAILLLIYIFKFSIADVRAQCTGGNNGWVYGGDGITVRSPANCTCGSKGCTCTQSCTQGGRVAEACSWYNSSCSGCVTMIGWGACGQGRCAWNGSYSCPAAPTPTPANQTCYNGLSCTGFTNSLPHGGTGFCWQGNVNYGCNNGSWYSQGTFCTFCVTPVINTNSCTNPGPTANIGYNAVSMATYYAIRIDDTIDGWNPGACNGWNGWDYCTNQSGTGNSWTAHAGHTYSWWVHACGANGVCSTSTSASFTCPSTPVNGSCSGSLNACSAGSFSDVADSPTQYLWNCVGSNGGSTASCAQNIPINGVCSASLNSCIVGSFSDVADSPTQYLWNCVGSNGGSTASCAQNVPTPTPTPTNTPTPTPTVIPYFKVKDTSFYKIGNLSSNFPTSYTAYDGSDTSAGGYFNQGQAGMVIASGSTLSAGVGGTAISGMSGSARNWTALNYSGGNPFSSTSFLNYVRAKKNTTVAAAIGNLPTTGTGGTYSLGTGPVTISSALLFREYITVIVNGDLTLSVADLGKDGVMFIVNGNVTINGGGAPVKFNGTNRPFALISTGTITFANALTEADGLYVGNAVNFGSGTTPLKIVGNVSSATAGSFSRNGTTAAPSMFIAFDPRHLMSIVDKVSTVKSSWTQLQ